jgi:glycosyltransferase involved in cell wall biosynthesis
VPVRPRGPLTTPDAELLTLRKPLLDPEIARAALAEAVRAPAATAAALLLLLRSPRPNVLLRNLAGFPKALWLARLVRVSAADHVHAHWAGPPSTVALVASRLSGVPWSLTAHATEIGANNLLREKSRSAVFVRFVAAAMMDRARRTSPGVDESRWVLLRLGIEVPPRVREAPPANEPPVLLLAASLVPGKGHDVLLEAVRALLRQGRRLEVWLAGAGPMQQEVTRRARELGLDGAVRFHGYVPNRQVHEWLASGRVDAVVLPSDSEGVPVSLAEALVHGVPAVATEVGGVPELLGDGCGLLVRPRDPAALAAAIDRLLASPELRAECARAGRERVEREFAIEPVVARLRELLFPGDSGRDRPGREAESTHAQRHPSGSRP